MHKKLKTTNGKAKELNEKGQNSSNNINFKMK